VGQKRQGKKYSSSQNHTEAFILQLLAVEQLPVLMVQGVMRAVQSVWAWMQRQKFILVTKILDIVNCLRLNIPTWRCLHLLQSSDSLATANQSALCIPAHRLMSSLSDREFHFYDGSVGLIKFYTNH